MSDNQNNAAVMIEMSREDADLFLETLDQIRGMYEDLDGGEDVDETDIMDLKLDVYGLLCVAHTPKVVKAQPTSTPAFRYDGIDEDGQHWGEKLTPEGEPTEKYFRMDAPPPPALHLVASINGSDVSLLDENFFGCVRVLDLLKAIQKELEVENLGQEVELELHEVDLRFAPVPAPQRYACFGCDWIGDAHQRVRDEVRQLWACPECGRVVLEIAQAS